MMLIGWGILAVPTGIVTPEMTAHHFRTLRSDILKCTACGRADHEPDAAFSRICSGVVERGGTSVQVPRGAR